MEEMINND
jgi:hypothetical protein